MFKFKAVLLFCLALFFLGCEQKVQSGPAKMNWDRDMCQRCVMVVSDRKNSVQLREPNSNKVHKFDDIGCMVLWFKEENVPFKESAEIWITDAISGEWIDARGAFYTTENTTPMAFGFSAYKSKEAIKDAKEIISYEEVVKRVK